MTMIGELVSTFFHAQASFENIHTKKKSCKFPPTMHK